MGKINSRQKGARAERAFAKMLREYGYEAERGCQRSGGKDSPDVKCNMPNCHWEIKHVERLNLESAMEQSKRDAGENEMPLVGHKKNRTEWLVTLRFTDFMEIFQKAYGKETQNNGRQNVDDGTSDSDG